ncbi:MAG: ATP-binding protein [Cytophagales bacterium]|nr:ATP-binding protein [Cytophagales bacterium]
MKYILRSEYKTLEDRLLEHRRFLISISGPRQIGKTTLVHSVLKGLKKKYIYITADAIDSEDTQWIVTNWEMARSKLRLENISELILAIDEIQKINNWSEFVKKCWDEDTLNQINLKIIILGSSRMLLQRGLTESMAGRFEQIYMGHWTYNEMQEAFDMTPEQYAWYGGYPGAAPLIHDEHRWKEYIKLSLVDSTLNRDILMLTRIDKPALLKRLFEMGSHYSSQIVSYNKFLGQLTDVGNTTTLSNYLQLTDDAGLLGGLEKYSGSTVRIRSSSPKFQVYNNALFAVHHSKDFRAAQMDPTFWGRVVESAVGAHLINLRLKNKYDVYYWREQNDEIDFIIRYNEKILGLEIKSGKPNRSKSIAKFKKLFDVDKILVIGTNTGMTWKDILKINPIDLF